MGSGGFASIFCFCAAIEINVIVMMMYQKTFIAAAPALLAIVIYYSIAPPFFCSGTCCFVKSTCADVKIEKGILQPKYEKVAAALAESLAIGWDLGASVFMVSCAYVHEHRLS